MSISASIIADSINPSGSRLTTFLLTYPRFIHSEFMTHRVFSRNAASSRAQPIEKMLSDISESPAWPEQWGSNQPGMQAGTPLERDKEQGCKRLFRYLKTCALECVEASNILGLHKQVANRYLEPWAHITVIATASDKGLSNFFALRASPMAQPEFQVLAYRMLAAYIASHPHRVEWEGWHVPFAQGVYDVHSPEEMQPIIKAAVGRCARVSYNRQDDNDPEKNLEIHDRCLNNGHWSPFEHVAQAINWNSGMKSHQPGIFKVGYPWSNFDTISDGPCGWGQYRKIFLRENQTNPDLAALLAAKPEWITL